MDQLDHSSNLNLQVPNLMLVYVVAADHVNDRFRLWLFGAARVDHAKLNVFSAVRLLSALTSVSL